MQLHNYWRSTSSYRARLLLNLKGLAYDYVPVDIPAGAQHGAAYRRISPNGFVPTLVDGEIVVQQTVAIAEYLEEAYPAPPLFPADIAGRNRVREFILSVAGDVQPRNQKRVRDYIAARFSHEVLVEWFRHWSAEGIAILEALAATNRPPGRFFHGDAPGAAECFLVPQLFNLRLRDVDLSAAPTLMAIDEACRDLPEFTAALPENQPDVAPDTRY